MGVCGSPLCFSLARLLIVGVGPIAERKVGACSVWVFLGGRWNGEVGNGVMHGVCVCLLGVSQIQSPSFFLIAAGSLRRCLMVGDLRMMGLCRDSCWLAGWLAGWLVGFGTRG